MMRVLYSIGPLARIGPNHLLLSDPSTIRKILANSTRYIRGPWYDAPRIVPHRANLVTERDERKHRVLRHQMAAGVRIIALSPYHTLKYILILGVNYAGNDIASLEPSINERIEDWISYIGNHALSDD
ncbi:hypothetical protein NHQ30_003481 [Ciborinia camelliae]|nr:hypothetical protein NHQ30_003481 [Ciborinia camelliae]